MLHNLREGIILVVIILFLFLGNVRGALIVALTIPFALLFASICLDLRHIPANLLSLGALDFGMVVDGAVVMVENIVRHLSAARKPAYARSGANSRGDARSAAAGVLRDRHHHHGVSADLYAAGVEGRLFKPMAWTVAFALLGALMFSIVLAPVLARFSLRETAKEWHNPVLMWLTDRYRTAANWAIEHRYVTVGGALALLRWRHFWCSAA